MRARHNIPALRDDDVYSGVVMSGRSATTTPAAVAGGERQASAHVLGRLGRGPLLYAALLLATWAGHGQAQPKAPASQDARPAKSERDAGTPTATAAATVACHEGDLVPRGTITGHSVSGNVQALGGPTHPREGSDFSAKDGVVLERAKGSQVTVDLGHITTVRYLVIQAAARDAFTIEVSKDNKRFKRLWTPGDLPRKKGLITQWYAPKKPAQGRYLRLRGRGGDGRYHATALGAYCQRTGWPPKLLPGVDKLGWGRLDRPVTLAIKSAIGLAGAGVLWLGFASPYRRIAPANPERKDDKPRRWPGRAKNALVGLVRRVWGRPLRQRALLELPFLLAGVAAVTHTFIDGRLLGLRIGGGLLALWFILRWLTGEASTPRPFIAKLASKLTSSPGVFGYAGASLGMVAATWTYFGWAKALGAGVALGLLLAWLRWARHPISARHTATLLLGAMGLFGFAGWWNIGHFHFDHYVHIWEHYHYFIGAKYGPELRYSRIYECTAVADYLDGYGARVRARDMRQLGTDNNLGTSAEILKHPERCKDHFSRERWAAFRKDIRFFRARFSKERWDRSQTDHGYNATPVWGIAARLLADQAGTLTWRTIERLATIDSLMLIAMWLAILWAFGWQAAAVALIYWGCNFPARFYWNGGAFLRYDWLFTLGLGLCALRRNKHFLGGVALTLSTGLRVFPGLIIATLLIKAIARMVQARRIAISPEHARFAAGCITTIALLIPASHWSMDGLDAWSQFAQNSEKHLKTALTNNMGLKTVLGYDYGTRAAVMRNDKKLDPFQDWKDARVYYYAKRKPLLYLLIGLFMAVLAVATTRDDEDWMTACLGVGLIPIAVELTCYYYGFLFAYGLMWPRRKLPGILAAALAGLTNILNELPWNDDKYVAMSLATVVVVTIVTAHVAFGRRSRRGSERRDHEHPPANAPETTGAPAAMKAPGTIDAPGALSVPGAVGVADAPEGAVDSAAASRPAP